MRNPPGRTSNDSSTMKVLADADLFLELFLNRGGSVEAAEHFLQMLLSGAIEVYVTDRCVETIRFYTSKPDIHVGKNIVSHIEAMLSDHIILIDNYLIEQARTFPLRDFDSAVELACAIAINLGAIVTQSPENFAGATLPVFSVSGLIERHRLEASLEVSISSLLIKEDFIKLQEPVLVEAQCLGNDSEERHSGFTEKSLSKLRQLIKRIVEAETDDFFELAKIAGLNPSKDFSAANLSGLDLRTAKLAEANFIATNLSKANLANANLAGAMLVNANLAGAMLVNANLSGASLVNAEMKGAKLIRAQLVRADLTGADMTEANLNHVDLQHAVLIGCKLDNASLHLASLNHVDLRHSSLNGADLQGASLVRANLSCADLRGVSLVDANLSNVKLNKADLTSADLRQAFLTNVDLADAKVKGAKFLFSSDLSASQKQYLQKNGAIFKSIDPAASGRGMEADLLPNLKIRLAVCSLRRRAAGNLPVLD